MNLDRRQFIRIGAAGALAAAGCGKGKENDKAALVSSPGPELQVDFEGLYIIEGHGANTKIRLIDGEAVDVPTHLLQLRAYASAIDQTKTKPEAAHVVPAGADYLWLWDLKGNDVALPKADSGANVVTSDDTSGEDGADIPSTEPGWHSLKRVPDLKELCGATKVNNMAAVASTVALKHGHLTVLQPTGVGATAVWKFLKSDGTELVPPGHKAISNKVRYIRPNNGNQLVIEVGSQKIYFKQGVTTQVLITNYMSPMSSCPPPCTPNMNHFKAFLKVVDKQFDSAAYLVSYTAPSSAPGAGPRGVEPDYCPGSRV
jgi:hypothetical protein